MAKLLLIRHGEPSYAEVSEKKFKGHGRDLASLTIVGINQAKKVAKDSRLKGSQIIISSPYTRTLQTAAIISRELDLDIKIELDIHEWLPDLTYSYINDSEVVKAAQEMTQYKGEHNGKDLSWEPLSNVAYRAINSLKKYLDYDKIIVVTHAVVMRQFEFKKDLGYCEIIEVEFDELFKWNGWIEH